MTGVRLQDALALWGLEMASVSLAARRENVVWKVEQEGAAFALRMHRRDYRTAAQLRSELDWMRMLAGAGISVPAPVPAIGGELVACLGGQYLSLLTWLPGTPIGALDRLDVEDAQGFAHSLGAEMARLHDASDAWSPPAGFDRPDWRRAGLLGDAPLWGRFWEHPDLAAADRALLQEARARADADLRASRLDEGLIHGDLLTENILSDGARIGFLDFDDGAWGYRPFELATFLLRMRRRPDAGALRAALCAGYETRRPLDAGHLDLCLLLRALTYPGWVADRLNEPGAAERSRRAIDTALDMARGYLDRRGE